MPTLGEFLSITALVFGFGFVVFWHELGHFLAAKWVGIKVEQFAVGFGQAILSYRKGLGVRIGSSNPEMAELERAGADLSRYGETEYRLNWIPLGGYVKMLGQDDLNPTAQAEDPRAYNKKSISARMFVVSAGVVMNVILAAILFMVVFLIGFNVAPPTIGSFQTGSPAQLAGLQVGDRIVELDGQYQHSFDKLLLNTALARSGTPVPVKVERDGKFFDYEVRPVKSSRDAQAFLNLGIGPVWELAGPKPELADDLKKGLGDRYDPKTQVLAGDTIEAVNGKPVSVGEYEVLDEAVQQSGGKPVALTVKNAAGETREVLVDVRLSPFFGETPLNLAGLQPRPVIVDVAEGSPVQGKLLPGDVVTNLKIGGEDKRNPTVNQFIVEVGRAGQNGSQVALEVERNGAIVSVDPVVPTFRTGRGKRGFGVSPAFEESKPVAAGVLDDSPAAEAKIPAGALLLKVNDKDVATWFDVHATLKEAGAEAKITYVRLDSQGARVGEAETAALTLEESDQAALDNVRYSHGLLMLRESIRPRQTDNPATALAWGVTETRDLLLQFYVTLHRLVTGDVSVSNFMGPIGIVHAGSLFATKGADWLIWFLAMISANLAVVNFLPIPIVDGGLFAFLIVEKIQGRPLSPRAQTVAQLVGLAIILSVFLLVTYQDIARLFL